MLYFPHGRNEEAGKKGKEKDGRSPEGAAYFFGGHPRPGGGDRHGRFPASSTLGPDQDRRLPARRGDAGAAERRRNRRRSAGQGFQARGRARLRVPETRFGRRGPARFL